MPKLHQKLVKFLNSPLFFVVIMLFFVIEATWIAFSARYPMAFDESYHVGIIKLYAHQLSPIFSHQPPGDAPYGALTRDPSYLFHWLMSFPYRWLGISDLKSQVIVMRMMNVAMFAGSLILFRKVLLKVRASAAVVHTTLLFYVLIPIVPLLAAHVNYDNLQNLLLAWVLLLVIEFREELILKKRFHLTHFVLIFVACTLGSLVKFTFLPILTAVTVYMLYLAWRFQRPKKLRHLFAKSWLQLPSWRKVVLSISLFVSLGLFIQMYGVNVVKYHNLIPQCGQVLTVDQCMSYGPWARNYRVAQQHTHVNPNPIFYTGIWVYGMFTHTFFMINGPGKIAGYENHMIPIISLASIAIFVVGLGLLIRYGKQVFKGNPVLLALLFISFVYIAAVWGRNYHDYIQLGAPVAINGRYLIPVILPINLAIALAYQRALAKKRQLQSWLAFVTLLCFMQGGGTLSFIAISNDNWYWPGDTSVQNLNHTAKKIVDPLTLRRL